VEIRVFDSADETVLAVARRVALALGNTPDLVLGLPAGRTPIGVYAELARLHAEGEVDFSHARSFNVDEFVGIAPTHTASFHRFIAEHLLDRVNIRADRRHSLDGLAHDLDAECERYDSQLEQAGGVGLQLLGIGTNGHIGFNEPADALFARTHRVALLETTRRDNAGLFGGNPSDVPHEALSIGMGTILRSDVVLLVATGPGKATAVQGMVDGPITTRVPASLLQVHRSIEVYLDRDAASRLRS